jgi:hypothetical protein
MVEMATIVEVPMRPIAVVAGASFRFAITLAKAPSLKFPSQYCSSD